MMSEIAEFDDKIDEAFLLDFLEDYEDEHEEDIVCKCYGRGKVMENMIVPRIPLDFLANLSNFSWDIPGNSRRRGMGRGKLLEEIGERVRQGQTQPHGPVGNMYNAGIGKDEAVESITSNTAEVPNQQKKIFRLTKPKPSIYDGWLEEEFPSLGQSKYDRSKSKRVHSNSLSHAASSISSENLLNSEVFSDAEEDDNFSNTLVHKQQHEIPLENSGFESSAPPVPNHCDSNSCYEPNFINSTDIANNKSDCDNRSSVCQKCRLMSCSVTDCEPCFEWRLSGSQVVQVEGLPSDADTTDLKELVSSFGTLEDMEIKDNNGEMQVRFQLDNEESCEWVVSCLHDTDCPFSEIRIQLEVKEEK